MLPDPEAAIGCIPDEMQKGPDKALSEPQLDISNSFLLQLIIFNCIYAFKYCPLFQM